MLTSQCRKPTIKVEVSSFVWRVLKLTPKREIIVASGWLELWYFVIISGKLEFQFSRSIWKSSFTEEYLYHPSNKSFQLVNGKWKIPYKKNTKASTAKSKIIIPSSKAVDEDLFSFNFLSMVIVLSWSKREKRNFPEVDYRQSLTDEFW